MQDIARKVLSHKALAYYSSASDEEICESSLYSPALLGKHDIYSHARERQSFQPLLLPPASLASSHGLQPLNYHYWSQVLPTRVRQRSSACQARTSSRCVEMITPSYLFLLLSDTYGTGEANITQGAGRTGIIQMVSSNASLSYTEIAHSRVRPDQVLFFQLYKNKDNAIAAQRIHDVERLGYKAIFLTVDAPITGNRERDVRSSWELEEINAIGQEKGNADLPLTRAQVEMEEDMDTDTSGTAGGLLVNDDIDMTWHEVISSVACFVKNDDTNKQSCQTIPWLRSVTKLPILLKGIQCVEVSTTPLYYFFSPSLLLTCCTANQDAVLAAEAGVDGILVSNHGGESVAWNFLPPKFDFADFAAWRHLMQVVKWNSTFFSDSRQQHFSGRFYTPHFVCLILSASALPSIEVLYKIRKERPDLFDKMESTYLTIHHMPR